MTVSSSAHGKGLANICIYAILILVTEMLEFYFWLQNFHAVVFGNK